MRFVVIEGLDGSGKSTQINLLTKHLEKKGIRHRYLHFPRLEEGIYGKLIARFLRGEMGPNDRVDPYLVALLFAGDRADSAPLISGWMDSGELVLADRYVYSNIAFQCAKLKDADARGELREWILDLEFGYNRLPRPDKNLFLHVPLHFTREKLFGKREGDDRAYLNGERDIHEQSMEFQEKVMGEYLFLAGEREDLEVVECVDDAGEMLPAERISERICDKLNLNS